jgi:hypothetical protein
MKSKPAKELFEAWHRFAASGIASPASAARALRILEGTFEVARVAGGVLGFRTISSAERAAIDRIRQALSGSHAAARPN